MHHLAFNTGNYDATIRRFEEAGFESRLRAEIYVPAYQGTVKACHFETRAVGSVILEVLWKSWLVKGA